MHLSEQNRSVGICSAEICCKIGGHFVIFGLISEERAEKWKEEDTDISTNATRWTMEDKDDIKDDTIQYSAPTRDS